jgi:hypothetical protein
VGKKLTVANATKISIGQPILRVAIAQLATYKMYLAPVIFRLHFVKKLFSVIKLFIKIVNESFFKHFIVTFRFRFSEVLSQSGTTNQATQYTALVPGILCIAFA